MGNTILGEMRETPFIKGKCKEKDKMQKMRSSDINELSIIYCDIVRGEMTLYTELDKKWKSGPESLNTRLHVENK